MLPLLLLSLLPQAVPQHPEAAAHQQQAARKPHVLCRSAPWRPHSDHPSHQCMLLLLLLQVVKAFMLKLLRTSNELIGDPIFFSTGAP
jgi:hypothetical protein